MAGSPSATNTWGYKEDDDDGDDDDEDDDDDDNDGDDDDGDDDDGDDNDGDDDGRLSFGNEHLMVISLDLHFNWIN